MIATFYYKGYFPQKEMYFYTVLCDSGAVFETLEPEYFKTGTKQHLPDDMCQLDSGWIQWQCEKDGLQFWTRTRPGGKVICPMCGNEEECPLDTRLMTGEASGHYIDDEKEDDEE